MIKLNTRMEDERIVVEVDVIEGEVGDLMGEIGSILSTLVGQLSPENMLSEDIKEEGSVLEFRYALLDTIVEFAKDLIKSDYEAESEEDILAALIKETVDRKKQRQFDNLVNEWYEIMSTRVIDQDEMAELEVFLDEQGFDVDTFFDAIIDKTFED